MPASRPHLLILGVGSIGERHLRCFQNTGRCDLSFCEPLDSRRADVAARYGVSGYRSWQEALDHAPVTAALVASPAPFHVPDAIGLASRGLDLFIEKPLSLCLDRIDELRAVVAEKAVRAAVAYVYRALPALRQMRDAIHSGRFGDPVQVQVHSGQHFPFYRPAYRDIYYADPAMGGGAIQDMLPHHVNAVEWIVGPADRVVADAAHAVLEGVTVEDTVNFLTRHGPVLGSFSANQHQPVNEFVLTVHCQRGSARWEMKGHRWLSAVENGGEWTVEASFTHERDDFYRLQAEAFLDHLEHGAPALCPLEDGITTLKTTIATLDSLKTGRWITPA
jgi:predicted dehydrogenase